MIFQSAMSAALAETVLRSARCGVTKTLTITDVSLPKLLCPAVLNTSTDWNDGTYVIPAITSTSIVNNLFVGIPFDYPSLRTSSTARWGGETQGLVQVYGLAEATCQVETSTSLPGKVLVPNINTFITVPGPFTAAASSNSAHTEVPALGGLAILLDQIASSSATSVGTATVFLRCM